MSEFQFSTVEEALEDLKNGKIILVADDEDRENERRYDLCSRICDDSKMLILWRHTLRA